MRILTLRISSDSKVIGGAEKSAFLHLITLRKLGHKAELYTNAKFEGVKARFVPNFKPLRWLWLWLVLPCRAVLGRYDIINPHSREDQIIFTLTKWLHHTPVVWKDPGDLIHNIKLGREGILGRMNQRLLIKAIKKADAIYMLNSEDRSIVLDRLAKLGHTVDSGKISVVPSDILFSDYDLKAKPPTQANKYSDILQNVGLSKTPDPLIIGTIIRLDDHKGVQYLLEAARSLNDKHNNLEFWIVGDGPYRPQLELISEDLDNVYFFGHQDDVSPYLNAIDIFVQPAEFEGWGRNVKEAMYFARAIVGSDVGGIAEQIDDGQTGLLFEPKNSKQLEQKLAKLIQDKKLRTKLGTAARKKALADGDYVDLVKTRILPIFKSALKK